LLEISRAFREGLRAWNVANLKLCHAGNLDQLIEQEIRISRMLHMLHNGPDALPLLLAAQAALSQNDQPWMHLNVEKLVARVRRDD
jgi:hypothetical protein